jgi:hypothetical protein
MNREQKIYITVSGFLIVATFVYIFSGILGLNLPKYYPELGVFSVEKLTGPSMGYYGKMGFTLLLSLPLSVLFYLFLSRSRRTLGFNLDLWRGLAVGSLLFGVMFFVAEEWHKWGITKPGLGAFTLLLVLFLSLLGLLSWVEKD